MGRVLEQDRADLIKETLLTKLIESNSPEDTEIVTYNVSPSATTTSDAIEIKTPSELNDVSKQLFKVTQKKTTPIKNMIAIMLLPCQLIHHQQQYK